MTAPLTPGDLERLAERASMFREAGMLLAAEAIAALLAHVRSLTERVDAIRRARDEVKAAGEAVAPRNDPVARDAVFARMKAAEKALSGLLEVL